MASVIDADAQYMLPQWPKPESPKPASPEPASPGAAPQKMWQDGDGPSFAELLDIINPLQHIPIVSALYRAITGDEIGLAARLAGAALYGGPLGFILAGVTAAAEDASGGRIDQHLAALFDGEAGEDASQVAAFPTVERTRTNVPPSAALAAAVSASAAPGSFRADHLAEQRGQPGGPRTDSAADRFAALQGSDRQLVRARLQAQRAQVQRAQAQLLLSRIVIRRPDGASEEPPETRGRPDPRAQHFFKPPADAGPDWYLRAMERAFRKHRAAARGEDSQPAAASPAAHWDRRAIAAPQPAL